MARHGSERGRQSTPFLFGVESFPICLLPHDGVANKVVGVSHGAARVRNEGMTKQFFDEGRWRLLVGLGYMTKGKNWFGMTELLSGYCGLPGAGKIFDFFDFLENRLLTFLAVAVTMEVVVPTRTSGDVVKGSCDSELL